MLNYIQIIDKDYDDCTKAFLKSEHVSSCDEWIELYEAINKCSYNTAEISLKNYIELYRNTILL